MLLAPNATAAVLRAPPGCAVDAVILRSRSSLQKVGEKPSSARPPAGLASCTPPDGWVHRDKVRRTAAPFRAMAAAQRDRLWNFQGGGCRCMGMWLGTAFKRHAGVHIRFNPFSATLQRRALRDLSRPLANSFMRLRLWALR
jgi:hypothetical protein